MNYPVTVDSDDLFLVCGMAQLYARQSEPIGPTNGDALRAVLDRLQASRSAVEGLRLVPTVREGG